MLARVAPSPVVELNRAVAVAEASGPEAGLAIVDAIAASDDGPLDGLHLFHATRAELLRRVGRTADARAALGQARALARTAAERELLTRRLRDIG